MTAPAPNTEYRIEVEFEVEFEVERPPNTEYRIPNTEYQLSELLMSQGRITCPRCGSNNFDTVTVCWKCGSPLAAAAAAQATAAPRANVTAYAAPAAQPAAAAAPVSESFAYRAAATAGTVATTLGNAAASNRAAFWLGILMPYFGLPIGLAFIMCDDRRRQEVGRLCVMWSLISGVVHILLMFVSLLGMRTYISAMLGAAQGGLSRGIGGGGGLGGSPDSGL